MAEWTRFADKAAPPFDRIMVAGWQPKSGSVAGYWWWHEDMADMAGEPIDHPDALIWCPIDLPPFPTSPEAN